MKFARIETNKISGMTAGDSKLSPAYYRELDMTAKLTKEGQAILDIVEIDEKEIKDAAKKAMPVAKGFPIKFIEKKKSPVKKIDLLEKTDTKKG